jgi:hypothetical protein
MKREINEEVLSHFAPYLDNGEVYIKKIHWNKRYIDTLLPYGNQTICIYFEGETAEEIINSISGEIYVELDNMINHLGDVQSDFTEKQ